MNWLRERLGFYPDFSKEKSKKGLTFDGVRGRLINDEEEAKRERAEEKKKQEREYKLRVKELKTRFASYPQLEELKQIINNPEFKKAWKALIRVWKSQCPRYNFFQFEDGIKYERGSAYIFPTLEDFLEGVDVASDEEVNRKLLQLAENGLILSLIENYRTVNLGNTLYYNARIELRVHFNEESIQFTIIRKSKEKGIEQPAIYTRYDDFFVAMVQSVHEESIDRLFGDGG